MKKGLAGLFLLLSLILFVFNIFSDRQAKIISPLSKPSNYKKTNYKPYSFTSLRKRQYYAGEIRLEKTLKDSLGFISYLFSFSADGKYLTGMANIPRKSGKMPVAILIRGWVDEKIYQTGMGTGKMAEFLAERGFLTLSPDLLGYGGSDPAFDDVLLTRFFRPVTIVSLLESLESLPPADSEKVVFWAHSNGGQIALSVLEVTGRNIPTSLWAPVTASFPESVLHFAGETEDNGEKLRQIIVDFEKGYDPSEFSINRYLGDIKAPLMIHQGTNDESIPPEWTELFLKRMKDAGKKVDYYSYPEENHNFTLGSAPLARKRDFEFYQKYLPTD